MDLPRLEPTLPLPLKLRDSTSSRLMSSPEARRREVEEAKGDGKRGDSAEAHRGVGVGRLLRDENEGLKPVADGVAQKAKARRTFGSCMDHGKGDKRFS